jgi:hypothetical protein
MSSQEWRPPQRPNFLYKDRPDISETFADAIENAFFDGQTLRIEFSVSRLDPPQPPSEPTGRKYTACRLVLPSTAAVDLMNRMQQIGAALAKAGIVKVASQNS